MTGLEQLPSRMDHLESQIGQLRVEMHDGFSAVRSDLSSIHSDLSSIHDDISSIRGDISSIHGDISSIQTEMTTVRSDIEGARRETRVLFEEVVSRIKVLGEQRPAGTSRKRPVAKKR